MVNRRTLLPTLAAAGFVVLLLGLAPDFAARAANSGKHPMIRQITHVTTGQIFAPKVRLEQAETIAFAATADVMGPGTQTANRELYLFNSISRTFRKLTNTVGGESYDPSRETDITHSGRPKFVAFVSTGDLDPSVGNEEHNPEIFVVFTESGTIRQITNTPANVINAEPYPSDTGQCMVFRSNGNLDNNDGTDDGNPGRGWSNEDGSQEIFMVRFVDNEIDENIVTQVSNGPVGTQSTVPSIGGYWFPRQCRSTIYQSNYDQLGNGSTGTHIYNYTKQSGDLEQLTPVGAGQNVKPGMSSASNFARGPFVVYESNASLLGNPATGIEIFRSRLFKYELMQVTFQLPGESHNPVISDGGGFVVFESTSELIDPTRRVKGGGTPPLNSDGNQEIYRTKGRRKIWQITQSTGCTNRLPGIQDSGKTIAFLSNCDHVPGSNAGGREQIFVYEDTKPDDPALLACTVASGCCSVDNGCYQIRLGMQVLAPTNRVSEPPLP